MPRCYRVPPRKGFASWKGSRSHHSTAIAMSPSGNACPRSPPRRREAVLTQHGSCAPPSRWEPRSRWCRSCHSRMSSLKSLMAGNSTVHQVHDHVLCEVRRCALLTSQLKRTIASLTARKRRLNERRRWLLQQHSTPDGAHDCQRSCTLKSLSIVRA